MNKQDQGKRKLAAMAAGFDVRYIPEQPYGFCGGWYKFASDATHKTKTLWRPETDKADSFDLMVACGIVVTRCGESVIAESAWAPEVLHVEEGYDGEAYMKVVFYGAVKIGRSMEL